MKPSERIGATIEGATAEQARVLAEQEGLHPGAGRPDVARVRSRRRRRRPTGSEIVTRVCNHLRVHIEMPQGRPRRRAREAAEEAGRDRARGGRRSTRSWPTSSFVSARAGQAGRRHAGPARRRSRCSCRRSGTRSARWGREPVSGGRAAAASLPPDFAEALARRAGRLGGLASRVVWYDTVSSTNDVADRLATGGAAHGTVVAADCQQSGRGPDGARLALAAGRGALRLGRAEAARRLSDPAERGSTSAASRVTLTAGVALAEALRAVTGLPVDDQVAERPRRRAAEGVRDPGRGRRQPGRRCGTSILGFGVNVLAAAYPPEIADRATSIEAELGRAVDRAAVFAESLACLAERLRAALGRRVRRHPRRVAARCRRRASARASRSRRRAGWVEAVDGRRRPGRRARSCGPEVRCAA